MKIIREMGKYAQNKRKLRIKEQTGDIRLRKTGEKI
jgi:hypothetical protein